MYKRQIHEDTIDTSKKVQVIDWYYKRRMPLKNSGVRNVLHYCKFIPGVVLYASENDKELMHFSYTRYLENKIREAFGFRGTSLKFFIRERKEKDQ